MVVVPIIHRSREDRNMGKIEMRENHFVFYLLMVLHMILIGERGKIGIVLK